MVIPQLLMLKGVGSHADQPSCTQMAETSPFSPSFKLHQLHANRTTILLVADLPARDQLITRFSNQSGFKLTDTQRQKTRVQVSSQCSLSSL